MQTLEKCNIFRSREEQWQAGRSYYAGSTSPVPDGQAQKILRAIDIQDGEVMWELPQIGPANSWGGVLSTAGGIVVFGEDSGSLMAVDGEDGRVLWSFPTNTLWKASPITYLFDGKQHIAIASGSNILAFALTE
jgi:alcohol dehydrogenase (cytochrome c)